ncbi:hypothetical protein AY601_0860 [Pedobacter cryoconitis]|uniref:NHL repeat-containing protein n=1 Tax=Pedobacter cryoconitis TaxID=188932 RepID=A0A127V9F4_9SPHI|nr:NHL repeat-containing protein [Pedobacter cryoconitis]AMP97801.1 hypothetical protein AY601_0860 [Pedobacter cryoconitis]
MKRLMRWLQLSGISLLAVLAVNGCKKVQPQETTTKTDVQVTSFVGSGGTLGAYIDGIGKLTAFNNITGIAIDAKGNVYVNDQNNFCIRKITPAGVVSTFAGSGVNGYADGMGTAAQFSYLEGLAIDASDNLYVSDYGNNVIRKITPVGVVSTYAGNGQRGFVDGPVATAQFNLPMALAIDKAGNMYIGDNGNVLIRKISAGGVVSTYAGILNTPNFNPSPYSGPANGVSFGPIISGITLDALGNVYVLDNYNGLIYKITPTGNAVTWAGDGVRAYGDFVPYRDGIGVTAEFNYPYGIASDAEGNIYIADTDNQRIRKITPDSEVTTLIGNGEFGEADGKIADVKLSNPKVLVSNLNGDVIYFTERNRIRKLEYITTTTKPQNSWNNPQSWGNSH